MPSRYRKKPLAQFENGTRIYAPSKGEARYRVVATDPVSGERTFAKLATEEQARDKAREFEQLIAHAAPIRDPVDDAPRTIAHLAERYCADHLAGLSLQYREKQEYLLRRWVLPRLGAMHVPAGRRRTPPRCSQPYARREHPTHWSRTSEEPCARS